MLSQSNISPNTPMGATLLPGGGATFRTWAPRATAVYLNGVFSGIQQFAQTDAFLMSKDPNSGYWTGFFPNAAEDDLYHFYIIGPAGPTGPVGYKRDPYARELALDSPFPTCSCVIRSATAYPWHDSAFVTPDFSNMLIYQIHIGVYAINTSNVASTFLDVIGKIEYLADLGINVLQPLPIDEQESDPGEGYDGSDYFSPDFPYVVTDPAALAGYLATINRLLAARNFPPLTLADITPAPAQLKCLIDLCHLYGIAVTFDVVYNHAGGWQDLNDDQAIYFFDRAANPGPPDGNNQSLYFTAQGYVGGLSFALWNQDVCQFIINSASYYINEFHVDGFRYDEISALLALNANTGWGFCANLTDTLRFIKPRLLQNAEYWPGEYSASRSAIVASTATGGAGFDAMQHDALRLAIRGSHHPSLARPIRTNKFRRHRGISLPARPPARLASHNMRGKPRHRRKRSRPAHSRASRWLKLRLLVRPQPLPRRHSTSTNRPRHPTTLYGPGIPRTRAMVLGSHTIKLPDRLERS